MQKPTAQSKIKIQLLDENTDGASGASTNIAPEFYPNNINSVSWFEFKLTPNEIKEVKAGTGSILLIFGELPVTSPMSMILPYTGLECYFSEIIVQTCYSYPEVSMVLIDRLTDVLAQTTGTTNEYTFTIKNFVNPPYVGKLAGGLQIFTIDTDTTASNVFVLWEEIKYLDFENYEAGQIETASVYATEYFASAVDVEYNWIFVLKNGVADGGRILLEFPPVEYNLLSSIIDYEVK